MTTYISYNSYVTPISHGVMLLRALTFICFTLPTASVMADDKGTQRHLDHIETTARKPNVLLIYSDDHGWADLGVQGVDKEIRTPHLDQLTREGVRFARGYVSAPQCVPSRAGLITGRYQQRFGVEDNNKGPLPLDELTIAERLKPAGYVNGWVGKSHLDIGGEKGQGKESRILRDHMPHRQGFDEYFRGEMRQYYASHALDSAPLADAPQLINDNRFRVTVQTEAALSFLDRRAKNSQQPWFLYLAWYAPHVPLESPEPWFSQTPAHLPKERRQALAMIAAMDDGLGQIRAKLKAMGQEKDTLIFFIGDNGAPLKPGAWNGSVNAPLVGEKGMLTDGGVRVPFVAAWPGKIPAGGVFEQPVVNLDVAATANAIAGLPNDSRLDGVNLLPYITGKNKTAPHDAIFWRWRSQAAVLEFPWKLIQLGNHEKFLFDVTQPDGELASNNRLKEHPQIANRLEAKLSAWSASLQPPGPPEPNNSQDNNFFATHVHGSAEPTPKRPRKGDTEPTKEDGVPDIDGWIARNGTLAVKDGVLTLTPNAGAPKNARPFITNANLDLAGPVTVILRVRAKTAGLGQASITWRTKQDSFAEHQVANFNWPAAAEWQEVRVPLPEQSRILHIRINPPRAANGIEIQSIEMKDSNNESKVFRFSLEKE
jgi:uncharacterized sulfatase